MDGESKRGRTLPVERFEYPKHYRGSEGRALCLGQSANSAGGREGSKQIHCVRAGRRPQVCYETAPHNPASAIQAQEKFSGTLSRPQTKVTKNKVEEQEKRRLDDMARPSASSGGVLNLKERAEELMEEIGRDKEGRVL